MKKQNNIHDPYAEEEAQRYEKPIPSRACILQYFEEIGEPLAYEELAQALSLNTPEEQEALKWRLLAMVRDGQLIKMRSEKFGLINKLDLIRGYVVGHPDGHGFLVPEDGSEDLFLSPKQMHQVFDGDQILGRVVKMHKQRNKREAVIIRVLQRGHIQVVGRFLIESGVGFVVPDNKRLTQDIIIPESDRSSAQVGDVVVAEITSYPTLRTQAVGKVIEVLGSHMAPGLEIEIALRAYDLPYLWPTELSTELQEFSDSVQAEELQDRKDLKHLNFVTIDGDDAKDFDDAVYCEKRKKSGWTLYVAIADVSHYVKPGTLLDKEALKRGNSTYFPSRVIPMLPEKLSNGLCSLNPKVDRLVLVCELQIAEHGEIQRYQFYSAVIYSSARLTYDKVSAMLVENNLSLQEQYPDVFPDLLELYKLYKVLHRYRKKIGAINFEMSEPKVLFDENKKIKALIPLVRNDAHRLIEECMLCANVAAAQFFIKNKAPGIFRIHSGPKEEKLEDLLTFLGELGLGLGGGTEPTPKDYAKLLEHIENRPDRHLIQTLLLRSMMQAQYSVNNTGHFGLAFEAYTHFTSPIRRYPDLIVHRLIKAALSKQKIAEDKTLLTHISTHCSMTERRSDEASRGVMSWLKCEFMLDKVGEEFKGVISSVTSFGLFVELQDIYVEGLVHISNLENDYYHYDAIRHQLTGSGSGRIYSIGKVVKVRVARVNLDQRQIDFQLLEEGKKKKKHSKSKKFKSKKR